MYICSCCDQLWYRHSVKSAHLLRKSNPSVDKYLLNKTSVDNTEWICISKLMAIFFSLLKSDLSSLLLVNGVTDGELQYCDWYN